MSALTQLKNLKSDFIFSPTQSMHRPVQYARLFVPLKSFHQNSRQKSHLNYLGNSDACMLLSVSLKRKSDYVDIITFHEKITLMFWCIKKIQLNFVKV